MGLLEFAPKFDDFERTGQSQGDSDVIEPKDIRIAEAIVEQLLEFATADVRRQHMQGHLAAEAEFAKEIEWHTDQLIALQRTHLARVREHARALINCILWRKRGADGKIFLPWDEAMEQRARFIDLALILHDLCKVNPREPGGVNMGNHMAESASGAHVILRDILHKNKDLNQKLEDMVKVAASPYALHGKHASGEDPVNVDGVIVCAANTLDYVDFWGPRSVIWIRQHPQIQRKLGENGESVRASIAYAKDIREEARLRLWNLKFAESRPLTMKDPLKKMVRDYEKRSTSFFTYLDGHAPVTFQDFRRTFGAFFRGKLRKCIKNRDWTRLDRND